MRLIYKQTVLEERRVPVRVELTRDEYEDLEAMHLGPSQSDPLCQRSPHHQGGRLYVGDLLVVLEEAGNG